MSLTKEELISAISSMSALELIELTKELENKFGISAAAAMPMMGVMPAQQSETPSEAAQEEEQTEFTVMLESSGEKKIQVIKEIRAITTLALKDAKDLVDSAPVVVKEGIGKAEAEDIKKKLEDAGAVVKLK